MVHIRRQLLKNEPQDKIKKKTNFLFSASPRFCAVQKVTTDILLHSWLKLKDMTLFRCVQQNEMTRTPISDKNLFDVDDREVNFFYWSGLSSVQFRLITNTKIPLAGLRTFLRSLKETSWYFAKIDQLIQLIQLHLKIMWSQKITFVICALPGSKILLAKWKRLFFQQGAVLWLRKKTFLNCLVKAQELSIYHDITQLESKVQLDFDTWVLGQSNLYSKG